MPLKTRNAARPPEATTKKKKREKAVVTSLKRQPKVVGGVAGCYRSVCSLQSLMMWWAMAT